MEDSLLLGSESPLWWAGFLALVLALLALDLLVFNRKAHEVRTREALRFAAFWVALAIAFGGFVWWKLGATKSLEYFTGYIVEESLSVDNLFVIALVFGAFGVPRAFQHRVLFWGILGALFMRGSMIIVGASLVARFEWILYVFGAFLLFTGARMLFAAEKEPDPRKNRILRLFRRVVPSTDLYDGSRFFTRVEGRVVATPLLAALVVVETMDLVFAVDSIPAIFAITTDPFIVFTSNIFAILGLRTFYFLLVNVLDKFVHLKVGLAIILAFIGGKMLAGIWDVHVEIWVSLLVIVGVLLTSVLTSILATRTAVRAAEHRKEAVSNDGPDGRDDRR